MHYQSDFDQLFKPPAARNSNALRDYIHNSDEEGLLDLPRQIPNNPFTTSRPHPENRPFYSRNNQSISKCAVTEISSKAEEEYEESITPVCQKLFDHTTYSRIEKQFDLPQTLPSEQLISQATFKPNDLRDYLKDCGKEKQGSKLKQILRENVFNKPSIPKEKVRVASSHVLGASEQVKQKTKYQKILEEYFNSRSKKEAIKSRLSQEKMPSIKMQYLAQQSNNQTNSRQTSMEETQKNRQKPAPNTMKRSRSEKQITNNSKVTTIPMQKSQLTKTFSQKDMKENRRDHNKKQTKDGSEGWMKMSFLQRQSKTLQNRKSKQNIGQKMNKQNQVKNCTFKPAIIDFKPQRQAPVVSGSYARLYLQKIRRRM